MSPRIVNLWLLAVLIVATVSYAMYAGLERLSQYKLQHMQHPDFTSEYLHDIPTFYPPTDNVWLRPCSQIYKRKPIGLANCSVVWPKVLLDEN